jgi:predicted flavoprotein YhiN
MRTTLTLEHDVAAMLERLRKTRRQSLKSLVNEALRQGLERLASPPRRREPFRTSAVSLGGCRIGSIDNVAEVLAVAEGDSFR